MSSTRYEFADCPECGAEARIVIEPPERSHGYRYPGYTGVEPSCDCIDEVDDVDDYENDLIRRAA